VTFNSDENSPEKPFVGRVLRPDLLTALPQTPWICGEGPRGRRRDIKGSREERGKKGKGRKEKEERRRKKRDKIPYRYFFLPPPARCAPER